MNFEYTQEQRMYREAAREFLTKECPLELVKEILRGEEGYSPILWKKIADLGWLGMLVEEKYGGAGGEFLDMCPILEEIGRALFPSPFFATVIIGGTILSTIADESKKAKLLPALVNGTLILSHAIDERVEKKEKKRVECRAERHGEHYRVAGKKLFVHDVWSPE